MKERENDQPLSNPYDEQARLLIRLAGIAAEERRLAAEMSTTLAALGRVVSRERTNERPGDGGVMDEMKRNIRDKTGLPEI